MKKMLILLLFALSTFAAAQDRGQFRTKETGNPTPIHNDIARTRGANSTGANSYAVPEPAAIALLGIGLVSLGIYAKKKQGKKS
ncbi:MAG: PEP-CTERM sorting domain-containing protein [Candidatus Aminicenantes bacterium]|nr:PEP-CTERM sorting domain-containing protein [Candidatus Aminicenantes bacterium]